MTRHIPFPSKYKKSLIHGTKDTTIRINQERGRYEPGKIYEAKSYKGKGWGIKIKILKIISTTLEKLSKYRIPKRSIRSIGKSPHTKADLIRFRTLR